MSQEARLSLQREISRTELEVQRQRQDAIGEMDVATQDAEAEVTEFRQQAQIEFETKLQPVIDKLATDTGLDFLFAAGPGMIWGNRSLDLTQAVIEALNATTATPPSQ